MIEYKQWICENCGHVAPTPLHDNYLELLSTGRTPACQNSECQLFGFDTSEQCEKPLSAISLKDLK